MSDDTIRAIYGFENENGAQLQFSLGERCGGNEITRISYSVEDFGDHGIGWYAVHSEDVLLEKVQAKAIAEVMYKVDNPDDHAEPPLMSGTEPDPYRETYPL